MFPLLISERYRIMIYNGDVDGCVPYTGDEVLVVYAARICTCLTSPNRPCRNGLLVSVTMFFHPGDRGWWTHRLSGSNTLQLCVHLIRCVRGPLLQVADYITEYDQNGFKFVTVKGSGHMVCSPPNSVLGRNSIHTFVHPPVPSGVKTKLVFLVTSLLCTNTNSLYILTVCQNRATTNASVV